MDTKELRQRRASLWEQAKSLHELAAKEKRDMTAEEKEQWDRINAEIDSLGETIQRMERIAAIDAEMERTDEPTARPTIILPESEERESILPNDKEYARAFNSYLRRGMSGMPADHRALVQTYYGATDVRALGVGTASAGGALVPEDFYRRIVEAMKAFGGMRQRANLPGGPTIITTSSGAPMPIPSVDDTGNTGAILAEGSAVTEQDITFAVKTLGAYVYTSKLVRVSVQLLQDSAFNLDAWLPTKLGERIGRAVNAHYTNGTGTDQPEGILAGAGLGVSGSSATTVTYDELVELEHSIDPAYRLTGAQWMFNDATLAAIKALTDNDGRPLWLPGLNVGAPDTILGYPYVINQDVPAIGASAKSILFGNFSYYFIRDVVDVRVLRLDERYAEYLQVGFLAFMRTDGKFVNPSGTAAGSPIKYLQNAAS